MSDCGAMESRVMRSNDPQAMSPSHRKLLRESSLGTDGQVMAGNHTSTGCYVRDPLSTVHDDGPGHAQSASANWGSLKEKFLEQGKREIQKLESGTTRRHWLDSIAESSKLQEAAGLLSSLTNVAGDWSVHDGKAVAFLEHSLGDDTTDECDGDRSMQAALKLLDFAEARGFDVVRSSHTEMGRRTDVPRTAEVPEWLVPAGKCVVWGVITTDHVDVVIADVAEDEVGFEAVAHVAQGGSSDVHSSRLQSRCGG